MISRLILVGTIRGTGQWQREQFFLPWNRQAFKQPSAFRYQARWIKGNFSRVKVNSLNNIRRGGGSFFSSPVSFLKPFFWLDGRRLVEHVGRLTRLTEKKKNSWPAIRSKTKAPQNKAARARTKIENRCPCSEPACFGQLWCVFNFERNEKRDEKFLRRFVWEM